MTASQQFDDALEQLVSVRRETVFEGTISTDAEMLKIFSERLLIAAGKLHAECNRSAFFCSNGLQLVYHLP